MLQRSGVLSDPTADWTIRLARVTKKRTKVEADYEEMAQLEIAASLYMDEDGDVCVIDQWIEGLLRDAGRKRRMGKGFEAAVFATQPSFKLDYEGRVKGLTREAIAKDPKFRDRRKVDVNGKAVWRCRPVFKNWSLDFEVVVMPGAGVTVDDVGEAITTGGALIGLSDHRPKFGRYKLDKLEVS